MYFLTPLAPLYLREVDSMLVITRKKFEKIIIANDIEITILDVSRNRVRFGIQAPKQVVINTRVKDAEPALASNVKPIRTPQPEPQPLELLPAAVGMPNRR
jgi:hypothetical protein